jgi:transcriptional regulator with XRE-family HTH domain
MDRAATISNARGAARMSQDHLAQAAGVSVRTVIRAEGGHPVSHESLRALCAVLGLEATDLDGNAAAADAGGHPGGLRAALSRLERTDDPVQIRKDFDDLSNRAASSFTGARAVARPDVEAYRKRYNQAQGAPLDPCVPDYYARLRRLYMILAFGFLAAIALIVWLSGMDERLGLLAMATPAMVFLLAQMGCMLVRDAERTERALAVTLYVVDATHLHGMSLRRPPRSLFRRRDEADLFRCSIPLGRITDVTRHDTQGRASLTVTGGRELNIAFIDTLAAAQIETLLGFKVRTPTPTEAGGIACPA